MRRLTIPLVLLLVLALAAFLYLVPWSRRTSTREGESSPAPEPVPTPPILTGRGTPLPEPAPVPSAGPSPDALPVVEGAVGVRWIVRGTIRGLDPALPGGVQVYAHPVLSGFPRTEQTVRGPAPEGAEFQLDVSPFFAKGQMPTHVEVVVDHPAYAKERTSIDVAGADGRGPRVLRAEITLRRANAIAGTVVDEEGKPQGGVAVALFPAEDGMPLFQHVLPLQPIDHTTSDGNGRYRLRTTDAGTFFVIAASDRLCPASRMVDRSLGEDRELDPLVLRTGYTIEGRVTWRDEGVSGATLRAIHYGASLELTIGPGSASWSEGNVVVANRHASANADGTYRMAALSPVEYRVQAHVELPDLDGVSPLVARRLERSAVPPATGVDLEIQGVPLRLRVFADGSPLRGAVVQVNAGGSWLNCVTDAEGLVDVLLAADAATKLHLRHDGYAPLDVEIPPAPLGATVEKEVVLAPEDEKADLVVVLEGEYALDIQKVSVSLAPPDRELGNFGPPSLLDREKGEFRLRGLEAGRYLVTVRPGQASWHVSGYYLRDRRILEIPDHGEVRVPVDVGLGGRIRIAAREEGGALLAASCIVRDDRGNEMSVVFATWTDAMSMSRPATLGELSPSLVDPPLEAGTYTVELRAEGRTRRTLEVDVTERKTTDIDVVLPRAR